MKSKLILSIGIPAYNEELTITRLVESVVIQKNDNYFLKEIIIVNDGSSDNILDVLNILKNKYKNIRVISDGERKGKTNRVKQIYKESKGEVIILLDADLQLTKINSLSKLLSHFADNDIVLVAGNKVPTTGRTIVQKALNKLFLITSEIKNNAYSDISLYNVSSAFYAIRSTFAIQTYLEDRVLSEAQYLFIKAKQMRKKMYFEKTSSVYFSNPATLNDFVIQYRRFTLGKKTSIRNYGEFYVKNIHIPVSKKIEVWIKNLLHDPAFTVLAGILHLVTMILPADQSIDIKNGIWRPVKSTKLSI